jgi:hypothetical protein
MIGITWFAWFFDVSITSYVALFQNVSNRFPMIFSTREKFEYWQHFLGWCLV